MNTRLSGYPVSDLAVLSLLISAFLSLPAVAQDPVVNALIDPISLELSEGTLTIVFDDLRADTSNTSFEAQHSDNVTRWTGIAGSVVGPHPSIADRHVLTAASPGGLRKFYRVVGYSTTADDRDGDGLSDGFEESIGTNPDDADTDHDGFNDGTEFSLGTGPKNAATFPDQVGLPEVDFATALSAVTEGGGLHRIDIQIEPSYEGLIYYSVSPRSSAEEGTDVAPLSGTTIASGNSAEISIEVLDDLTIDPQRLLLIDLTIDPPGNEYRASGAVTHVVCIKDNDSYWSGVLKDALTERNFRVCMAQDATTTQASFVSGDEDGLLQPDGGVSSQSTGLIPDKDLAGNLKKIWPATFGTPTYTVSPPNFYLGVADLPAKLGGLSTTLKRSVQLIADPNDPTKRLVEANRIIGTYTEILTHATDPSIAHLNRTMEGVFTLVRDFAEVPDVDNPFDPTDG